MSYILHDRNIANKIQYQCFKLKNFDFIIFMLKLELELIFECKTYKS